MQYFSLLSRGWVLLVVLLCCAKASAETLEFDSQRFIDTASVRSMSEIEVAKVALRKSESPLVQRYAETMIAENTLRIDELRVLASQYHLSMFSDAELQTKARKYVFERKGQTFDTAYAGMRAAERRKMVNLYRQAINSDNPAMKHYAERALPSLMHQLYMAQELVPVAASTPASHLMASK